MLTAANCSQNQPGFSSTTSDGTRLVLNPLLRFHRAQPSLPSFVLRLGSIFRKHTVCLVTMVMAARHSFRKSDQTTGGPEDLQMLTTHTLSLCFRMTAAASDSLLPLQTLQPTPHQVVTTTHTHTHTLPAHSRGCE